MSCSKVNIKYYLVSSEVFNFLCKVKVLTTPSYNYIIQVVEFLNLDVKSKTNFGGNNEQIFAGF
mgnify:CR=1 FL=1|jgi:hypothetical protein